MNILGISAARLDRGACLLQDGRIIATAQEERFACKKNKPSFPLHSIEYCLQEGKADIDDIDIIALCDKPFLQAQRILATSLARAPMGIRSFLEETPLWITQQLWILKSIFTTAGFKGKIIFTGRHQSLAAAAFFSAPFSEAAVLTLDAGAERATTAYGLGSYNTVDILAEQLFPHSLDLLYSAFSHYLGCAAGSGADKFMESAALGKPTFKKLILSELIDLKEDGSFKLNMNYFDCCTDPAMNVGKLDEFLGRIPQGPALSREQWDRDLACSAREVIEDVVLQIVQHLHRTTGQKKLCMLGDAVLNCVDKKRILAESAFDELYVQPVVGGALGTVLFSWHAYLGKSLSVAMEKAALEGMYLGPEPLR